MKYTTEKIVATFPDGTPPKIEWWIRRPDGTPVAVVDLESEARAMAAGLNRHLSQEVFSNCCSAKMIQNTLKCSSCKEDAKEANPD
jgi:hypothetical protein